MTDHWEIAWTSLRPLDADGVEKAVDAIARLGCSSTSFQVEAVAGRYVAVRHRKDEEFLLEFGFAQDAPGALAARCASGRGLVESGHIVWNWCCTSRRQPETGLIVLKFRQVQKLLADNLVVWDDDGNTHWSWGSCPASQANVDPMALVDAHLRGQEQALAS